MNEETNFPRGGSTLPNKETKSASVPTDKKVKRKTSQSPGFLFGSDNTTGALKGNKRIKTTKASINTKSSSVIPTSVSPLGGGAVLQPTSSPAVRAAFIESHSFKKLAKGTKLLGIVREVTSEYALISLPQMLTGFVQRGNNGISLDRVVSVGTVLPVIVLKASSDTVHSKHSEKNLVAKKRIELSIAPSKVNYGYNTDSLNEGMIIRGKIQSVEDHGCLVDIGISSLKGCFLKFENVEGEYETLNDDDDDDDDDEMGHDQEKEGNFEKFRLNKGRVYDFTVFSLPSNKRDSTSSTEILQLKLQRTDTRNQKLTSPIYRSSESSALAHAYNIRTLMPGMLVSATVERSASNGLCVTFLNNLFRGAIDLGNLGGFFIGKIPKTAQSKSGSDNTSWWKSVFVGKFRTVTARIIAVDPITKIVRLSLLPHILSLKPPDTNTLPSVGSVIENATVVRLDHGVGALIAFSTPGAEDEDCEIERKGKKSVFTNLKDNEIYKSASRVSCAFVHISKAIDEPSVGKLKSVKARTSESVFAKMFTIKKVIPKIRILSTAHWMDNLASCATAESIVSAAVLTYQDLKAGAIYKDVTVASTLQGGGILVHLGGIGIKGHIPGHHLFDKALDSNVTNSYRNKVRMEKFKEGNKINVRCLLVNARDKKCTLTAKKALLSSDLTDAITDYSTARPNQIATGFISRVSKVGLSITFYNNVFGRVSAHRLAEELGVEDPTIDYKMGDVIKARVLQCRKRKRKIQRDGLDLDDENDSFDLELSLNLSSDKLEGKDENNSEHSSTGIVNIDIELQPGFVLPPKCMKIVELILSRQGHNALIPGHAIVSIKPKYVVLPDDKISSDKLKDGANVKCKIPFEHLLDSYEPGDVVSANSIDNLARRLLKVGKKIAQKGLVIARPSRDGLPLVSLKSNLIETCIQNAETKIKTKGSVNTTDVILPTVSTSLFMGALVHGYCARIDSKYGTFVRFFDNFTGLLPKAKGGTDLNLYDTVICKVIAIDVMSGKAPKILLKRISSVGNVGKKKMRDDGSSTQSVDLMRNGDNVGDVKVEAFNFSRAIVTLLGTAYQKAEVKAIIHVTMGDSKNNSNEELIMPLSKPSTCKEEPKAQKINKYHPFHKWEIGSIIHDAKCVAVTERDGVIYAELTNCKNVPSFFDDPSRIAVGTSVQATITSISSLNKGIGVHICPGVAGFIPGLELSDDVEVLNNMEKYFKMGGKISCHVTSNQAEKGSFSKVVQLSALKNLNEASKSKPRHGDLVIGRINLSVKTSRSLALMFDLGGGFMGRCDITELEDVDNWVNMPLGREPRNNIDTENRNKNKNVYEGNKFNNGAPNENVTVDSIRHKGESGSYTNLKYVRCRVLSSNVNSSSFIEVSLRKSRLNGDLNDDEVPKLNDICHAYVVSTNRKGCFLRLSRSVEGKTLLKELSDSFLPDPFTLFSPGRLVVGKIKKISEFSKLNKQVTGFVSSVVELDMRESILLENRDKLIFDDIKVAEKYTGIVTRVEPYGVFVRFDNSEFSGMAHLSECSDKFVKNITALYNPGDLVKAIVINVDEKLKRIGLSLRASHFIDDVNSDEDSDSEESSIEGEDDSDESEDASMVDNDEIVSDDENYVSKLANNLRKQGVHNNDDESSDDETSDSNDSDDSSSSSSSSEDEDEENNDEIKVMDTDVGFDWDAKTLEKSKLNSHNDSDSDESDTDVNVSRSKSHKSRTNAAIKVQQEKEVALKEERMADGTANENPETSAEFERLIASEPNSSVNWIKYMAYHLSLADVDRARVIANRAFERIEFRQEGEKLNIWSALLTLELKYGTSQDLQDTIKRASQQNNPKQVYLRVCGMLEGEVETSNNATGANSIVLQADKMFAKMCKKFKSKKTVWIAHFKYLLKCSRQEEAYELSKKSLVSLPTYKHITTMSKYAQLEYEYGSSERARSIFESLLDKYPKKMDIFFVYVDKEMKHVGEMGIIREIFERKIKLSTEAQNKSICSDKHMKSLFKKWYRIEDEHGDEDTRQHVKLRAKNFVEKKITTQ